MVEEASMKLEYEDFQELLSRPPPEWKDSNAFNRNTQKQQTEEEGANENHKDGDAHQDESGFERNQISRGGGFTRGRGRGRGGFNNAAPSRGGFGGAQTYSSQ
jgi:hypothetical protein